HRVEIGAIDWLIDVSGDTSPHNILVKRTQPYIKGSADIRYPVVEVSGAAAHEVLVNGLVQTAQGLGSAVIKVKGAISITANGNSEVYCFGDAQRIVTASDNAKIHVT